MSVAIKAVISLSGLIFGSVTDLRSREVPDWLNYGLMMTGVAIGVMLSVLEGSYVPILKSIAGLALFYGIGALMYYTGQWGGGDSKMIMGLGAIMGIGFTWPLSSDWKTWPFMLIFIIMTLIAGAVYGIAWTIFLAIKNRKAFLKDFSERMEKYKTWKLIIAVLMGIVMTAAIIYRDVIYMIPFSVFLVMIIPILFYLSIAIKSIEKVCMIKKVTPDKLTEGDWIAKDIKVGSKIITGPKDLGVTLKKIEELKKLYSKKKIGKVTIKEGIPFVPSFLMSYIATLYIVYLW